MAPLWTKIRQWLPEWNWSEVSRVAGLMFLTLFTVVGIFLMALSFMSRNTHHTGDSTGGTNQSYFTSSVLTSNSNLVTLPPPTCDGHSTTENLYLAPRGHGRTSVGGDKVSGHFGQLGDSSNEVANASSVTTVKSFAGTFFSTASSVMATTFKTIVTSAAIDSVFSTPGVFMAFPSDLPAALTIEAGKMLPSPFASDPTRAHYISIASHMMSEEGVIPPPSSTISTDEYTSTEVGAARSIAPHPSGDPASATTTGGAATLITLDSVASTITSSTGPNAFTYGPPTPEATIFASPSSAKSPSTIVTSIESNALTSTSKGPTAAIGESTAPNEEQPTETLAWSPTQPLPSTLTSIEATLSGIPSQGVATNDLTGVISSISSKVAASEATPTVTSVPVNLPSPTTILPTQVVSVPPTSASGQITTSQTSTPTIAPFPSKHSKKSFSIGLGVCIPIIVLIIGFIILWFWIRYTEKEKKDDLEEHIVWMTHVPITPNDSRTILYNKTREDVAEERRKAGKAVPYINPLAMHPLNEEELKLARQYGLGVDAPKSGQVANAQQAADIMTSARSPRRTIQRRSGGTNLARQWIDGATDTPLHPSQVVDYTRDDSPPRPSQVNYDRDETPPRPSQVFNYSREGDANPFDDVNENPFDDVHAIGLAVSTDDSHRRALIDNPYRQTLSDLAKFAPTRLSTITDKSGEVEMSELTARFEPAGRGSVDPADGKKSKFLERFLMKKKILMPLEEY